MIKAIPCSEYFPLLSGVTATRSALNAEESELFISPVRPPRRAPATSCCVGMEMTLDLIFVGRIWNKGLRGGFFVLHQHSAAADKESSERPNIRSSNKSVFSSCAKGFCLLFKSLEHKRLISYCWCSLMMVIRLINNETGVISFTAQSFNVSS